VDTDLEGSENVKNVSSRSLVRFVSPVLCCVVHDCRMAPLQSGDKVQVFSVFFTAAAATSFYALGSSNGCVRFARFVSLAPLVRFVFVEFFVDLFSLSARLLLKFALTLCRRRAVVFRRSGRRRIAVKRGLCIGTRRRRSSGCTRTRFWPMSPSVSRGVRTADRRI
jgi:hypothetical protein